MENILNAITCILSAGVILLLFGAISVLINYAATSKNPTIEEYMKRLP